ncbi:unnamed protein product [Acanthoscelides obtectus]|uniref:Uncharacterized protein n=1 Tax=Acanthoscelides obtectus TaxID=200917 RepID=A0A9P0QJ80_ACAOB|nr:unnamed protein product [Acanthoscelides obtectus]CAK1685230.1 hypothetical protein AOBTE_LOCUS35266 [Acanthoscelides obtectus]
MPLVVVILPKTESLSKCSTNTNCWDWPFELRLRRTPDSLGVSPLPKVRACAVILHCTTQCLKCAKDHMTHLCPSQKRKKASARTVERHIPQIAGLASSLQGGTCKL